MVVELHGLPLQAWWKLQTCVHPCSDCPPTAAYSLPHERAFASHLKRRAVEYPTTKFWVTEHLSLRCQCPVSRLPRGEVLREYRPLFLPIETRTQDPERGMRQESGLDSFVKVPRELLQPRLPLLFSKVRLRATLQEHRRRFYPSCNARNASAALSQRGSRPISVHASTHCGAPNKTSQKGQGYKSQRSIACINPNCSSLWPFRNVRFFCITKEGVNSRSVQCEPSSRALQCCRHLQQ